MVFNHSISFSVLTVSDPPGSVFFGVLKLNEISSSTNSTISGFFSETAVKSVYYIVVVHNFNLQEKTASTVELTTNFVKTFKAHFEKKLLY